MLDSPSHKLTKSRIQELISDIRGTDTFRREKAVEIMRSSPTKRVVLSLIPLLYEKDPSVRMAALEVLRNVRGSEFNEILNLFSDGSEDVRIFACELSGHLKIEKAIPYLLEALRKDTDNVKLAACVALGEFKGKEVVDALLSAIEDSEWVAFSAISSLGKIKDERSVSRLLTLLDAENELLGIAACGALLNFRDRKIIEEIVKKIKGFEAKRKKDFLKALLENIESELFPFLYESFGDELLPHLRDSILLEKRRSKKTLELLRYFKRKESVELILQVLNEIEAGSEEYEFLISVLCEAKDVWAEDIASYLGEHFEHIVRAAIKGGIKIDEDLLIDVFLKSSLELKRDIVKNLPNICADGERIISVAIKDKDGHVRGEAADLVGRKRLTHMEEEVCKMARSDYPDVRIKALNSLLLINKERGKSEIERMVKEGGQMDKKIYAACSQMLNADENYPYVMELVRSQDIEERRIAMRVVEFFVNDERYLKVLDEILASDSIPYEALKIVKDKKLVQFKERVAELSGDKSKDLWTRYFSLLALSSFQDKTLFPLFVKALDDENPLIRIAGIKCLLSTRKKKALKYILPLKEDEDENVRMEAYFAEKRLAGQKKC